MTRLELKRLVGIRIITIVFPPLGLLLLWRQPETRWSRKWIGTFGILLYCIPYAVLVVSLMVRTGVVQIEWRGGFPPVLTRRKTVPDYAAVEADRARSASVVVPDSTTVSGAGSWPGFRGTHRDAVYTETRIRTNWPSGGLIPIWRKPIGGGYSSFAIAGGRAYTIEQRREKEAIACYDLTSGQERWVFTYAAFFDESMGGEGPRATPAIDGDRIYSLGATGEFHCLDAETGRMLWHHNILAESGAANLAWAQSASPLVVDDLVILQPGGVNGRSVVARNKRTGEVVWTSLSDEAAYSSPMVVTLAGQRQLLIPVLNRVVGLRVDDGAQLWEFPWIVQLGNRNIAQPVVLGSNRFLLSAGYGTGCVAVEIIRSGDAWIAREVWRNRNLKNKFTSSVFWSGHVYGLDEDILVCLNAETGARMWKGSRYGYGQLLLADNQLVILCGDGDIAVVRADPDRPDELARFRALDGKTWNHPAMASGRLLVRNAVEMACFDLREER